MRLARGERLAGLCPSRELPDLSALPFPRWDLVGVTGDRGAFRGVFTRPIGGFPVMASRSCPEFCTYCPHRILTKYRGRTVENVADERPTSVSATTGPSSSFAIHCSRRTGSGSSPCAARSAPAAGLEFECETRLDRPTPSSSRRCEGGTADDRVRRESVLRDPPGWAAVRSPRPISGRCSTPAAARRPHRRFLRPRFNNDTWESIAATIDYSISLRSTLAQFKLLTPYPATPLFKHMEAQIFEADWESSTGSPSPSVTRA
jgi:hypothetical protein